MKKDSYIRLEYSTREGKFYLGSDEVTFSCHIAVYDEDNNKILSTNIRPEYELDGTDPEEAIYEIEEATKRTWTTGDTRPEMLQFIKDYHEALEYGNDVYELNQLTKQSEKIATRMVTISERIA